MTTRPFLLAALLTAAGVAHADEDEPADEADTDTTEEAEEAEEAEVPLRPARAATAPVSIGPGLERTLRTDATSSDSDSDSDSSASTATSATSSEAAVPSSAASRAYVLPEPPALVVVGEGGGSFDEPSSPSDFAIAAGTFFDESGALQAGGGIEVGVRAFGLARRVSARDYLDKPGKRIWSRTYFSLATAEAPNGDDLLGAVGFRSVLLDGADPLLDSAYVQAAEAAIADCREAKGQLDLPPEQWVEAIETCTAEAYDKYSRDIEDGAWNAFGLVLSGATSMAFIDGTLSEAGPADAAGWLSMAFPVGPNAQLGTAAGWRQGFGARPNEVWNTWLVRGGIRKARLRSELSSVLALPDDPADPLEVRFPITIGGEFRLEQDSWLAFDFGLIIDPATDTVTMLSEGSFAWGQASAPSFKPED